jgi:hypothetical protein
MMPVLALILAVGLTACGPKTPEQMRRKACKNPELYSKVEIIPPGRQPTRPYKVIGAVDAQFNVDAAGRMRTLQVHACSIGADAIMGLQDTPAVSSSIGNEVTVYTTSSAMAIIYTDDPDQSGGDAAARTPEETL